MATEPNPSAVLDEIVDRLSKLYPPVRTKMSDNGNGNSGSYQAVRVEVDAVRDQLNGFKSDINSRFASLSGDIQRVADTLGSFIQSQNSKSGDGFFKVLTLIGSSLVIGLAIISAFGSLAKTNLDTNIAFTNDKIAVTNGAVTDLAKVVTKLSDTVVPRPEFEYRNNANRDAIREKADTHLVDEIVKRVDGNAASQQKAVDYLERQLSEMRTTGASKAELAAINERVTTISNRLNAFQQSFTALPKGAPGGQ